MGFVDRGFNTPVYIEEFREPERVVIISCEGENTEPEYFETVKTKLSDHISVLLEIIIVPRTNAGSEPQKIVCNLKDYIEDRYDYKSENDEMWVVWDREKVPERKKQILAMIPECKENNFHIAMTNPLFEFWLLLHIVDISTYDKKTLYDNDWMTPAKKKRFLEKEILTQLYSIGGYNKKKGEFNKGIVTLENIQRALEQEKLFENELEKIIDTLGSNVGALINKILKI
jgi:hypothetical protein